MKIAMIQSFLPSRSQGGVGHFVHQLCEQLARRGHDVTVVCNCPRQQRWKDVSYIPLDRVRRLDADVLILNTTGGALDIRPAFDLDLRAQLRMLWIGGITEPQGLREVPFDILCAPSNFIRRVARDQWAVPPAKLAVFHNGVEKALLRTPIWSRVARQPHRLVYCGHPNKGLLAALAVLRLLRAHDPRFELHIYGGDGMYGGVDTPPAREAGTFYHGTVRQPALYRELQRGSFALHLQDTPEAFGIALAEAMAAGCIVLASAAGALPELVRHGWNGFLVPGHYTEPPTWEYAAGLTLHLVRNESTARYIRANACHSPFDWETVAATWEGYWAGVLDGRPRLPPDHPWVMTACPECGSGRLALADGYHCLGCGLYGPSL